MSMQICILSDTQLNSTSEWQQAIDAESFPLRLCSDRPLMQVNGFMPADFGRTRTGFEYRSREPCDITDTYRDTNFSHSWRYCVAVIWGGDINELQAAWMAAAAYARATDGAVFDEQEGKLLSANEAISRARDLERTAPKAEATLRSFMRRVPPKS